MAAVAEVLTAMRNAAGRYRGPLTAAVAALVAVLLAALALPVRLPDAGASGGRDPVLNRSPAGVAEAEDLSPFLTGKRWGVELQKIIDEARRAAEEKLRNLQEIEMTRELAEIGFVGLMVEPSEYAVLLVLPDGKISRVAGGDTLPDGRTLVSVTDNSLSLEGSDGQQDVLPLFPRIRTE